MLWGFKTCVETVTPTACLWCDEQLACGEEFGGFRRSVNDCGKKRGVPQTFFLEADWLMLLSGHRVPREDGEPCVICWGFYKQRQAWKRWDKIPAKGRNEKSIRNAFPFFSLLSVFGRTAAAITLLYTSPFWASECAGCHTGSWVWCVKMGRDSIKHQAIPLHAQPYTVKRATSSWDECIF